MSLVLNVGYTTGEWFVQQQQVTWASDKNFSQALMRAEGDACLPQYQEVAAGLAQAFREAAAKTEPPITVTHVCKPAPCLPGCTPSKPCLGESCPAYREPSLSSRQLVEQAHRDLDERRRQELREWLGEYEPGLSAGCTFRGPWR